MDLDIGNDRLRGGGPADKAVGGRLFGGARLGGRDSGRVALYLRRKRWSCLWYAFGAPMGVYGHLHGGNRDNADLFVEIPSHKPVGVLGDLADHRWRHWQYDRSDLSGLRH